MLKKLGGVTVALIRSFHCNAYVAILLNLLHRPRIPTDEHLPDLIWCREPFFEELNEIEALNDIPN